MSTIKVDTIATRTGSGNITLSNNVASLTSSGAISGTNITASGTLAVTGATTTAGITSSAAHTVTTSTHANASVFKSTGNTQIMLQDTDASANDQFWGLQNSGGEFNILTCNDDRASGFVTPMTITQAGVVKKPNNPSFLTYGSPTMTATSGGHGYFHSFGNAGQSFNNGSHYNNSTGKFTCPVAGKYMFGFSISRNQSYSGANQLIYIAINNQTGSGSHVGSNASASQQYDQIQVHLIYDMQANDYASATYYSASGSFTTLGSSPRNYFYGFLIG